MSDANKERTRFLKELKEFDDNFINSNIQSFREIFIKAKEEKEFRNLTIKEIINSMNLGESASQIDYSRIQEITNKIFNPFTPFYKIKDLTYFFEALSMTNLFLRSHETYKYDELRTYESKESMKKHYKVVIEDLKRMKGDAKHIQFEKTINLLQERIDNLYRTFPTQEQILQNFLLRVYIVLTTKKELSKPTQKIANITNEIIEDYFSFEKDKKLFSKNTNLNLFKPHHYCVGSMERHRLFHK